MIMRKRSVFGSLCIVNLYLCLSVAAIFFPSSDARKSAYRFRVVAHSRNSDISATIKEITTLNRVDMDMPLDSSNTQPYGVSSPFSLPPYDSLPPIPLPENTPPFWVYPPFTPQPPSTTIPSPPAGGGYSPFAPPPPPTSSTPIVPIENPPPSPVGTVPSPPESVPNLPAIVPNPPIFTVPSPSMPPTSVPRPPMTNVPSPWGFVPRPPVFLPPIVYPPPAVPPPPHVAPNMALWCVAKPSVPGPIIEEAMNYACGSGADCDQIQPSGGCFQPNTLLAHASYAFNSYWQRTKVAGGTCEFGGTAMLVTVDPSHDRCHFLYH